MPKFIAVYGGSFNPSTAAHYENGIKLLEQLRVDEVWYLVSPQNPFKSSAEMAPFDDRVAMAHANLEGNDRLIVQALEATYLKDAPDGKSRTAHTLRCLTRDFPEHRFVWAMGADNLADFHRWGEADYITDNFPLAVLPRLGWTQQACASPTAHTLPRADKGEELRVARGWFLLPGQGTDINATDCRTELRAGRHPAALRPAVARYAVQNGVYAPR